MQTNLYFDVDSNFIKIPKKNRKFDDEQIKKDKKRQKKEDYSKQRERKRGEFE